MISLRTDYQEVWFIIFCAFQYENILHEYIDTNKL